MSTHPKVTKCFLAKVPANDNLFNCVILSLALLGNDWDNSLREAFRTLKPGGLLVVVDTVARISDAQIVMAELGFVNLCVKITNTLDPVYKACTAEKPRPQQINQFNFNFKV